MYASKLGLFAFFYNILKLGSNLFLINFALSANLTFDYVLINHFRKGVSASVRFALELFAKLIFYRSPLKSKITVRAMKYFGVLGVVSFFEIYECYFSLLFHVRLRACFLFFCEDDRGLLL